ncbi:uncharacterized protein F5Z01DRAFT_643288 [Emericellopsis atlantica]|uniref:Uncharacterized protein n=1 Tax=Emericellopsis atlantica TaxID=2614577 RepID=A0A9P7ZUF0_9HYPO|nr:uncharacterized protein F5Z01DRAFT_643288 [Emericellopsis atlantica]KAG9258460.1 hypothetical protein F5Z01DRAFT_643288 [Emericellopsis atlantica]
MTGETRESEAAVARNSSAAAESVDSPHGQKMDRAPSMSPRERDTFFDYEETFNGIVNDPTWLLGSICEGVDQAEDQETGGVVDDSRRRRFGNMDYGTQNTAGVPHDSPLTHHAEDVQHTHGEGVDCWTSQIEALLGAIDGHATADDQEKIFSSISNGMIAIWEDERHREQLMTWIDNRACDGADGLDKEFQDLQRRILAMIATIVEQCSIRKSVETLTYGSTRPLSGLITGLDDFANKGGRMSETQAITKSRQMVRVLHILFSAYIKRQKKTQELEGKDEGTQFHRGNATSKDLAGQIEHLREALGDKESQMKRIQDELSYWKRRYEETSKAAQSELWRALLVLVEQTTDIGSLKRRLVDDGVDLATTHQEDSTTMHGSLDHLLGDLSGPDVPVASLSTERLPKRVKTLDIDSAKLLRKYVFPGSSQELAFVPDDVPRQTSLLHAVTDARDLDGFPDVQMILLPSGRAGSLPQSLARKRCTVLDAIDSVNLVETDINRAEKYIADVANQATAWTAIDFRVRQNRWKSLYAAVRKRLCQRVASNAEKLGLSWKWTKSDFDTADMLSAEELRVLARRGDVLVPTWWT